MDPMQPSLADAFKMSVEGDNVIIEFGHAAGRTAAGDPRVAVTDRIVLPRANVHRLATQLDEALRPHATGLRLAAAQALPPAQAAVAARPGPAAVAARPGPATVAARPGPATPAERPGPASLAAPAQTARRPAPEEAGDRAALLIRLVGELDVPHQYERSFRISERSLQANRFLLTFNTRDVPGDARSRVLAICDRMSMPRAAHDMAQAEFGMANCLHFGFEGDADSIICKLYLERAVPPEEARLARAESRPVLLHLAFKWDVSRQEAVTTRYHWFPALTAAEIDARLTHVYGGQGAPSLDIARSMLDLTRDRVATERLQYLEVEEVENDRRSFDLNLYNAKLQMKDIQPLLGRMREHFSVRPGQFQALYDQVKGLSLGHLAGGVHRNGKDFFNLYYGVVGLPHFSDRFQQGAGG
jgi:tryptophan halogenase